MTHFYDKQTLLRIFLNSLLKLQNVERGSIWIKQGEGYTCVEASGDQSEQVKGVTISNEQPSIVGWVIENGRRTISRTDQDSRHFHEIEEHLRIKSNLILCFPLVLESGDVYGAVELIDTTDTGSQLNLDKEYLELLENIVSVGSIALSKYLAYTRQVEENKELQKIISELQPKTRMIGQSEVFLAQLDKIRNYARADYPVLITGESGTGKELFARELHRLSDRSTKPFLVQNCSAIPETLLESELFGHKKGAFTGAASDKDGLFAAASGGTVFLDEIGEMPYELQARLLRVLQDGEIKPLGSSTTIHVDCRIVSATNVDLMEAISQKRFREDLYYRLNVLPVSVPALRERKEDIPLLLKAFLHMEVKKLGIRPKRLKEEVILRLVQHSWPGNIRELENLVRHMLVITEGDAIGMEDLPFHIGAESDAARPHEELIPDATLMDSSTTAKLRFGNSTWREVEERYVHYLLEHSRWNVSRAARQAGLKRSTFDSRMKRLGIRKG